MPRGHRTDDETIAKARRLRSEGMSAASVAKITGMGRQTIYNLDLERPAWELVEVYRCGGCGNKVYFRAVPDMREWVMSEKTKRLPMPIVSSVTSSAMPRGAFRCTERQALREALNERRKRLMRDRP